MTLKQLKAMSRTELLNHWGNALFPFDNARCGNCLTYHKFIGCERSEHQNLVDSAKQIPLHKFKFKYGVDMGLGLRGNLEQFFAMRLFYADQYEMPVPVDALAEAENAQLCESVT
jgi:hypothetical protein